MNDYPHAIFYYSSGKSPATSEEGEDDLSIENAPPGMKTKKRKRKEVCDDAACESEKTRKPVDEPRATRKVEIMW